MAHLIDKDAVLAEINKRLHQLTDAAFDSMIGRNLIEIRDFLDTLEVKEVDIEEYYHKFLQKEWFENSHVRTVSEMMAFTAKHFFELGLRSTITEDDCKLIWNIGDEIPNMPEEEFFKELLKRFKAQKGEEV